LSNDSVLLLGTSVGALISAVLGFYVSRRAVRSSTHYANTVFKDLTFETLPSRIDPGRTGSETDPEKLDNGTDPDKTGSETDPIKTVGEILREAGLFDQAAKLDAEARRPAPPPNIERERRYLREIARLRTALLELRQEADAEERRYRLLRSYATQGLTQGRVSFWASIWAATFGFIIILLGVVAALVGGETDQALVPIIGGAVIDAVSLLFFAQDRRHQTAMFDFFERLREDRKLDEALALLRTIADESVQSRVQAAMALHFAAVPDALLVLGQQALPKTPRPSDPVES
jgi:hypothetical protein